MRIALLAGTTYHWLAGNPAVGVREHSWAADFELTPESEIQLAQYVRGTHALPIDRGNLLENLSFTTRRLFGTAAEAQLYVLDYDRTMPRSGTLLIDAVAPTGAVTRRQMATAVVRPPKRRTQGATALLDYSVLGGEITAWTGTAPASITVSGTLTSNGSTPVTIGTLLPAAAEGGKQAYTDNGLTTGYSKICYWDSLSLEWKLISAFPTGPLWRSSSAVATPNLASGWTALAPATGTPTIVLNP